MCCTLTVQSVIFPKEDDWDLAGAKAWLKEHEDLTKGIEDIEQKDIDNVEEKSGATLSQKTKNMLGEICDSMNSCAEKLRGFIENSGVDEPPDEPEKTNEIEEIKQALAEIKSQVLILREQKDATEVIDLDSIEFPKAEKDAAQNELEIKPEELKQLITEIINNQIEGGN